MKINKQIRVEREKLKLSRESFVKSLKEVTGQEVSVKTVQRWEDGEVPGVIDLQCLAEFFGIKVSELLDDGKGPYEVTTASLCSFGEDIFGYALLDNISDLMSIFYITKKEGFESVPRYDIELQGVNYLLSSEGDYGSAIQFADLLFGWIEQCSRNYSSDIVNEVFKIFLHDDSVGSRSYFDPRTILDTEEMILIKDGIISKIYGFNQEAAEYLYDKNGKNTNSNIYFVKRKIFF